MRVTTATGSVYVIDNEALTVARVSHVHDLRRDGQTLDLLVPVAPQVGERMTMVMEPLSPAADVTVRSTSPVVEVAS